MNQVMAWISLILTAATTESRDPWAEQACLASAALHGTHPHRLLSEWKNQ